MYQKREEKHYFKEFLHVSFSGVLRNQIPSIHNIAEMSWISLQSLSTKFQGKCPKRQPHTTGAQYTAMLPCSALSFGKHTQLFWRNTLPETCLLIIMTLETLWKERSDKGTELCLENLILILPAADRKKPCFASVKNSCLKNWGMKS